MSVRKRQPSKVRKLMLRSGKFWMDRQGRVQRACRCAYCSGEYKRPSPGSRIEVERHF